MKECIKQKAIYHMVTDKHKDNVICYVGMGVISC